MTQHQSQMTRQSGVTLLENMIALVVLSVGLLGLAGLQAYTLRGGSNSQFRLYAMQQAEDMAGRIRANLAEVYVPTAASAYDNVAPVVTPTNGLDCRNYFCSAAALANFDVYQWQVANNALFPGNHNNVIGGYITRAPVTDVGGAPILLSQGVAETRMRFVITMVWDGDMNAATGKAAAASTTCPARTLADLNCYKLVVDL